MAEYIDRSALGIGYADPKLFNDPAYAEGWNSAIKIINEATTEDVVPVVRCKDCKYFNHREHECENSDVHHDLEGGAQYSIGFDVDDFCSFGERKENGNA